MFSFESVRIQVFPFDDYPNGLYLAKLMQADKWILMLQLNAADVDTTSGLIDYEVFVPMLPRLVLQAVRRVISVNSDGQASTEPDALKPNQPKLLQIEYLRIRCTSMYHCEPEGVNDKSALVAVIEERFDTLQL